MNTDLPFIAEYAKSNRAACKACKQNIGKDTLRMGVMVQSPHFDGKVPMWHHSRCFFDKKVVTNATDIANFDNLKWEDQNKIKEKIAQGSKAAGSKKGGAKSNADFSVEYSKSSRAACRTCGDKIQKGVVRISKMITDTAEAQRYGPMPGWRHVDCFVKDRLELGYSDSANKLPGFNTLEGDDKKMLSEKIGQLGMKRVTEEPVKVPSKKLTKEEVLMKSQNELLFSMRDKIKKNLSKKEMILLLEHNNQHISKGEQNLRDHLSDCLVFGAIKTCPECKSTAPRYKIDAYRCSGNLTEWTRCQFVTRHPEREPFKIPDELKEEHEFLNQYRYVQRNRLLPEKVQASTAEEQKGPLSGYIIAVFGKFSSAKAPMEKKIMEHGGAISTKINDSVDLCISTENEVASNSKKVKTAQTSNIHIVSPKFIEDIESCPSIGQAVKDNLICSWGEDPILKFGVKKEQAKSQAASTSSSSTNGFKSGSLTMKLPVKGGAIVDPQSGKEGSCHVFTRKNVIYNAVLGMVDLSRGSNSFYKLQLLESDKSKKCFLFRSWGRVGTTIGGNKMEDFKDAVKAVSAFEELYLEKTGNEWKNRDNFVKQAGCFYPLDIDYGQDDKEMKSLKPDENCKLPKPVQQLICLIFDIEAMKKTMLEFEIDLKKMPLGKLSKKQIEQSYSVLNEAQQIILSGANANKILDASNRFYTLIPHDFGLKTPPLLENDELIKAKIEMLDSLLEIEVAYNIMKTESDTKDPILEHYDKLKTDIEVLTENDDEFNIIKTYVKNTHADTHRQYELILNKVFKINRHGESERYKKFKSLHNKKLLWHGSRLTNFAGILSQGLRIAPPEAPVTGYMFGKGVYFADMVSKSANYCFTSRNNATGLLLLCEVALGNMYEKKTSEFVEKLPKGKHSTKGLGMTIPDPKDTTFIGDVEVPYGKPVNKSSSGGCLLYNEYIVYDVSQINIKYLLDVTFKWKY